MSMAPEETARRKAALPEPGERTFAGVGAGEEGDERDGEDSEEGESCGRIYLWRVSLEVKNTMGQSGPNTA